MDYELKDSYLTVTDHLFDADALVIENQNVHEVSLCDMEGNPYLTVTMECTTVWNLVTGQVRMFRLYVWNPGMGRCDSVVLLAI